MDAEKNNCKNAEEEKKTVATGFGGHEPEQFSLEGYEKDDQSEADCCDLKTADSEGRTEKLSGLSDGDDRQSTFVDDKEYLASSGGGRSFQYASELTDEDEKIEGKDTE